MVPRDDERSRTICLKVSGHYEEGRAVADGIYPGMLIELLDTEPAVTQIPAHCQPHSAQGVSAVRRIAVEDRLGNSAGNLMGKTIETEYLQDDVVMYYIAKSGDVFQLRTAGDFTGSIGDVLVSAGDGTFEADAGGDIGLFELEENVEDDETDADFRLVRARAL